MMVKHYKLILFSLVHFLVDFACIFFMYYFMYDVSNAVLIYLLYNFMAFALQMPIGLLSDEFNRNVVVASMGCGFIGLAYVLISILSFQTTMQGVFPILLVMMIGLGNGMYHVGAGIEVLNQSQGKNGPLGIFISPGAFGIYLGGIVSGRDSFPSNLIVILLLLAICGMIYLEYREKKAIICEENSRQFIHSFNTLADFRYDNYKRRILLLTCLFLVVCLRSYLGSILNFSWKNTFWGGMLISGVVFGKMAGGIVSDKLGLLRTSVVSLGLATVCFFLSNQPMIGVLGVFFFNMTMPITLGEAARQLHKTKGFAFGLLTFALFLGYLPVEASFTSNLQNTISYAVLSFVSLVILYFGLKKGSSCNGNA